MKFYTPRIYRDYILVALIVISSSYFFYHLGLNTRNLGKISIINPIDNTENSTTNKENTIAKILPTTGSNNSEQKFFVNSAECQMPYVDPFTKELLAMYNPPKFLACTNESDLVTPIYDVNQKQYVLHINEDVALQLFNASSDEYNCFYQEVIPSKERIDAYNKPQPPKYFSQDFVVPQHVEGMLLTCHFVANTSQFLQQDAFYLVQPKSSAQNFTQPKEKSDKTMPRKPSVIMFGIDSLSRINFRRTMPKVFELLNQRGWYEMQGYNKVADNTFPNLLAILSGYTPESAKQICNTNEAGCFDRFPLIWKYFQNASYSTAYAEDESQINTFNYLRPGFKNAPVDYYFRPYLVAIERNLPIVRYNGPNLRYCIGRRLTNSYIYDFCRLYMQRLVDENPIFGLFWSSSFSHDNYVVPALMADRILKDMQDFEADGSLNSTIMIFFADHGMRFGSLLNLPEGFLEERLPTMFIWLPPWFRAQYPEYARALQLNRNRLTSNYDLHMTLKHIIELGSSDPIKLPQAADCPKCQTLFKPVPENRACEDAGIADHWCTCHPYEIVTKEENARRVVPLVVNRMNDYFAEKNLSSLCSNLTLQRIHLIERRYVFNNSNDSSSYRAKFKVNPNEAYFQATLDYNNRTEALNVNVESISRLNEYRNDSLCIDDKEAQKYCVCYNSTKIN